MHYSEELKQAVRESIIETRLMLAPRGQCVICDAFGKVLDTQHDGETLRVCFGCAEHLSVEIFPGKATFHAAT